MHLIVRTDGGSRGNPGPAAAGVCVENSAGQVLFRGGFFLGRATNNVAEYQGILHGLTEAKKLGGRRITLYCDSELVTKQLNGQYRVKNVAMRHYYDQVAKVRETFEQVEFIHIFRHQNEDADAMVNVALDRGRNVGGPCDADAVADGAKERSWEGVFVEQLADKVRFNKTSGHGIEFYRKDGMATELICLKDGQDESFVIKSGQASLCVLRGEGFFHLNGQPHEVRAGGWVALERGQRVRLEAGGGQEFVALLTMMG